MPFNRLSINIFSRFQQTWYPKWTNTWAVTQNWLPNMGDPLPHNIATNQMPNGWNVTTDFDSSPPEVVINFPPEADRSSQYTVFVAGNCQEQIGNGSFFLPPLPYRIQYAQIEGKEVIQGLPLGSATEITVPHSGKPFSLCEYPVCEAPAEVRVSVLACGLNGSKTNEEQFVLLVENIHYLSPSEESPSITIRWTRRGIVD